MALDLSETNDAGEEWWALLYSGSSRWHRELVYLNFMTLGEIQDKIIYLNQQYDGKCWTSKLASETVRDDDHEWVVDGGNYGNSRQRGQQP